MTDGWRYACPYGHRTVSTVGGKARSPYKMEPKWVCDSCKRNFEIDNYHYDEVKDLKTGELLEP